MCLCRMERLAVVEVIRLVDDGEGIGRGDAAILVLSMMGQEGREARGEVSGEAGRACLRRVRAVADEVPGGEQRAVCVERDVVGWDAFSLCKLAGLLNP